MSPELPPGHLRGVYTGLQLHQQVFGRKKLFGRFRRSSGILRLVRQQLKTIVVHGDRKSDGLDTADTVSPTAPPLLHAQPPFKGYRKRW